MGDQKELYGGFVADGHAGMDLVPSAWGGRFPVQVYFRSFQTEKPFLRESEFFPILEENYFSSKKFNHCLTQKQVP